MAFDDLSLRVYTRGTLIYELGPPCHSGDRERTRASSLHIACDICMSLTTLCGDHPSIVEPHFKYCRVHICRIPI